MKLLYVTQVFGESRVEYRINSFLPCCQLSSDQVIDKIAEIQSSDWQKPFEPQVYLMHDGARYRIDYCPGCGKKIEIEEARRVQMVKRTKTVEYWDEA